MKNLLLLLVTIILVSCQKDTKPSYVLFSGSVENSPSKNLKIFGNNFEKDLIILENGTFNDTLKIINDGFYSLKIGREITPIYLTKGATLTVSLNAKEFDETLKYTGNIAAENNYLAAKHLLSEKELDFKKTYSLPEKQFIIAINKLNEKYKSLVSSTENLSTDFVLKEEKELEYAHINNLENYQEYYRYFTNKNDFIVTENFYDAHKDFNFSDLEAFNSSKAYKSLLETHFYRLANKNDENIALSYLQIVDEKIPAGKEKDELMTNYLRHGLKADANLEEVYALYKKENPNSKNLPKITERYNLLKKLTPGNASPTFKYENFNGGETSLEDLKGKVVYVDVWATWCRPCKEEIPFLKELEKEYHNKNIAFVSISVDEKKDYEKWRNMISERNLGGVQLFADNNWGSKFITAYGIKGIPRFILIDTEGNIINYDAPRPSSNKIIGVLNRLL